MINKAILRISSLISPHHFCELFYLGKKGGVVEAKAASNDEYQIVI